MDEDMRNGVTVITRELIDNAFKVFEHTVCEIKHQEVKDMKRMMWGMITIQLMILGGVLAALLK